MIVEPTSGNTGIGLAAWLLLLKATGLFSHAGHHVYGAQTLLQAYGAELVLSEGKKA